MSNEVTLKDCPFCGAKASEDKIDIRDVQCNSGNFRVVCKVCGSQGPVGKGAVSAMTQWSLDLGRKNI